jgi:hypothetical protein
MRSVCNPIKKYEHLLLSCTAVAVLSLCCYCVLFKVAKSNSHSHSLPLVTLIWDYRFNLQRGFLILVFCIKRRLNFRPPPPPPSHPSWYGHLNVTLRLETFTALDSCKLVYPVLLSPAFSYVLYNCITHTWIILWCGFHKSIVSVSSIALMTSLTLVVMLYWSCHIGHVILVMSYWSCHIGHVILVMSYWSCHIGHVILVMLYWSFYIGHVILVMSYWSCYIGHFILVMLYWSCHIGHVILVMSYWSCHIGHVILVISYWSCYIGHFILVMLYWSCYIGHVILVMSYWSCHIQILKLIGTWFKCKRRFILTYHYYMTSIGWTFVCYHWQLPLTVVTVNGNCQW